MIVFFHALAGMISLTTLLIFWGSSLYAQVLTSPETITAFKAMILTGMWVLIPVTMLTGMSGMILGGQRKDTLALKKMRRMPIILGTAVLVLLPAAFFLEAKSASGEFDLWFYLVQAIEFIAGASNFCLLTLNARDGFRMTGRIR